MGNMNSLTNKTDDLSVLNKQQIYRESSLFIFRETRLTQLIPDANVELLGFTTVRAGRDTHTCGKSKAVVLLALIYVS